MWNCWEGYNYDEWLKYTIYSIPMYRIWVSHQGVGLSFSLDSIKWHNSCGPGIDL